MTSADRFFEGRRVLITGGGGSVGTELVRQLLRTPISMLRTLDNNESALFQLGERFGGDKRLEILYCDVRDEDELNRSFSGIEFCFHAAALKHVPFCEHSPFSAVQTNINGSQQVIRAALRNQVERVLITSSDKAVNPTNVMGTSKLMSERLFTAANMLSEGRHRCVFSATRFGNVAGSAGSVIPTFARQIKEGAEVTLTDANMTRFIMTLEQAAGMVIDSLELAKGGEIFITKMPVLGIADLLRVMVRLIAPLYGRRPDSISIRSIGARPGEKMWEELNTDEEVRRTYELGDYLVVLPALRNYYQPIDYSYSGKELKPSHRIYHSANESLMTEAEIEAFLLLPDVLPADVRERLGIQEQ